MQGVNYYSLYFDNNFGFDGRNVVRKVIHKCLTCFQLKAITATQLMGQLPQERVKPSRPFTNSGVHYAGPFYIKQGQRSKTVKSYIALLYACLQKPFTLN